MGPFPWWVPCGSEGTNLCGLESNPGKVRAGARPVLRMSSQNLMLTPDETTPVHFLMGNPFFQQDRIL